MHALLAPLKELAEFEEAKKSLQKGAGPVYISGCQDAQKLHLIYGLGESLQVRLLVTHNDVRAREICEEFRFYDRNTYLFPAKDLIFFQADIHGNELTKQRIKVLRRLAEGRPLTIVTTYAALMIPLAAWDREKDVLYFEEGSQIEVQTLSKELVRLGYVKCPQVEAPGQFSVRGGIVDIFELTQENPYRLEFWGDEIDAIRSFDVFSQRSVEKLSVIEIYPACEFVLSKAQIQRGLAKIQAESACQEADFRERFLTEEAHRLHVLIQELTEVLTQDVTPLSAGLNVESYLPYFCDNLVTLPELVQNTTKAGTYGFFLDESARIREAAEAVAAEFCESMQHRADKGFCLPSLGGLLIPGEAVAAKMDAGHMVLLSALDSSRGYFRPAKKISVEVRSIASYNRSFEALAKDLQRYKKQGYRVLLLFGSRTRAKRIAQDLQDLDVNAAYFENPYREVAPGEVLTAYGSVSKGFAYPLLKFVVLSDTDIFGAEKKKKKKKRYNQGQRITDLGNLHPGDYVVHESHGLGIYQGIEKVEAEHVVKDYLKIAYADGGNLYIAATGLDAIAKYASADAKKPKLNKLGTKEWERTKTKVKEAVGGVARELVSLYAARQQHQGYVYGPDTVWQREFEEMFPFEETPDQLDAIADTKADMESSKIMDRLICGDVGYGKTEIAIRAAFKAVQEGKQVAYLVPTTILAQQHYTTFLQRFKAFPVRVDLLSRFRSGAQISKTLTDLKKGQVDIVIGTHRLLSDDVSFKDLGLLVIDEEQRFGVAHKEKIKKLRQNVDVLTLSATPIPRTLHMSLIGIRDMSLLEEAPLDRLPIQTFVCEYNEEMVREAISRELARKGQVYYVYNRVNNIADIAAAIGALVPQATVAYAHGQMKEQELEAIMYDFVNGEIDVLVSTTIIETGLDISNVNTMIIHDSDKMGLSQLYQLRGRVGRSNRTAYAFLMYRKDKLLKEEAEKRLAAIREFTDLGSGFKIAMRDLEIRGAGNLLGMRQHGHMEAVGYELYCKMLNEAVLREQGVFVEESFVTQIDLDVDAFIPPTYILNEAQKLDIYKRIACIETKKESEDMRDELIDRFGQIPKSALNLLRIALVQKAAHALYLTEVRGKDGRIVFVFLPNAKINPAGIPNVLAACKDLSFSPLGAPSFTYRYHKTGIGEIDGLLLLDRTEELLAVMERFLLNCE